MTTNESTLAASSSRLAFISVFFILYLMPCASYAGKLNVEWIAAEVAREHNEKAMTDDMTVSSTAQSIGKNVILKNVLRVKRNVSKGELEELEEYRAALLQEIVPKACVANSNNPAFKEGLFYTFVYVSHYGQPLAEVIINERICQKY
jgi:predicted acyltransferase (DUF342 family)